MSAVCAITSLVVEWRETQDDNFKRICSRKFPTVELRARKDGITPGTIERTVSVKKGCVRLRADFFKGDSVVGGRFLLELGNCMGEIFIDTAASEYRRERILRLIAIALPFGSPVTLQSSVLFQDFLPSDLRALQGRALPSFYPGALKRDPDLKSVASSALRLPDVQVSLVEYVSYIDHQLSDASTSSHADDPSLNVLVTIKCLSRLKSPMDVKIKVLPASVSRIISIHESLQNLEQSGAQVEVLFVPPPPFPEQDSITWDLCRLSIHEGQANRRINIGDAQPATEMPNVPSLHKNPFTIIYRLRKALVTPDGFFQYQILAKLELADTLARVSRDIEVTKCTLSMILPENSVLVTSKLQVPIGTIFDQSSLLRWDLGSKAFTSETSYVLSGTMTCRAPSSSSETSCLKLVGETSCAFLDFKMSIGKHVGVSGIRLETAPTTAIDASKQFASSIGSTVVESGLIATWNSFGEIPEGINLPSFYQKHVGLLSHRAGSPFD